MEAQGAFARTFSIRHSLYRLAVTLPFMLASVVSALRQQQLPEPAAPNQYGAARTTSPAVGLEELVREAEQNNPDIAAAQRGYEAATHVAPQVSALPDTQLTVQQFAVGSPRPF